MHATLQRLDDRIRRQTDEIAGLARSLDPPTFSRRPAEGRWSVAEHLAHLCNTLGPYLDAMEAAVERGRRRGWRPDGGELRETWLGRKFHAILEPPPRRRVKTFGAMQPPGVEAIERDPVLEEFGRCQERLRGILADGEQVDLGRARIASPFVPLLRLIRFPVHQSVGHMAAHNDRHLWLMREALDQLGAT